MDTKFLIFAGTREGRELAEYLSRNQICAVVSVATEYGEERIGEMPCIRVVRGRLDRDGMKRLIHAEQPLAVVDATHPYADRVSDQLLAACEQTGTEYLRLLRKTQQTDECGPLVTFPDQAQAAAWLEGQKGKILLTTGLKELALYAEKISDRSRLYARVLPQEGALARARELGLSFSQMICMQGPFTEELNAAMIRQVNASFLVTKESGEAGGFTQKVQAARKTGAVCVVIRRPRQESGYSMEEICGMLLRRAGRETNPGRGTDGKPQEAKARQADPPVCGPHITLVGIGMGAAESMTLEAVRACESADVIIGATRMLGTLARFGRPMVDMYRSGEIAAYIRAHPQYGEIVIGLSGDVGFYSGAKKLLEALAGMRVDMICGISSVVYFASRLQIPWEDIRLLSAHGRNQNLLAAVRTERKVFSLVSDAASVRQIAEELTAYGFGDCSMTVGVDLSYPTEYIHRSRVKDCVEFSRDGICVVLVENPLAGREAAALGISDGQFVRGNVPMTKEEVRAVVLFKLRLFPDAVVYDIGAGTGSISVECARIAQRGTVYAIERREDACRLIRENAIKFAVSNLQTVSGYAPEAFANLAVPTHAFIGGSAGRLRDILRALQEMYAPVRVVIDCIALETVGEVLHTLQELDVGEPDICCVQVSRARMLAGYHMMTGQNPVYIIAFDLHGADLSTVGAADEKGQERLPGEDRL